MQMEFPSQAEGFGKTAAAFFRSFSLEGSRFIRRCRDGNSHWCDRKKERLMKRLSIFVPGVWAATRGVSMAVLLLVVAVPVFAQANSPWENAVNVLQTAFTSTIARGLSLVAIVVSGLTFAFGEGGSKRVLAGVLFGVGMAIAAVNFLAWLFPA